MRNMPVSSPNYVANARIKRGERGENEGTLIILTDESRGGKRGNEVNGFEQTL